MLDSALGQKTQLQICVAVVWKGCGYIANKIYQGFLALNIVVIGVHQKWTRWTMVMIICMIQLHI